MNVGSAFGGGGVSSFAYDFVNAQEVQVTVAGGMGESDRGGPAFNIIPKTGGNSFSGTAFASTAGKWSQGSNLDDELRKAGITEPPGLIKNWDTNLAVGGPIKRDRLWFFNNLRSYGTYQDIPGLYANANALNAARWDYAKDPNVKARSSGAKKIEALRLTGQINRTNKVGFYWEYQANCTGSSLVNTGDSCRERGDDWIALGTTTTSPESGNMWPEREKITQGTWTSPLFGDWTGAPVQDQRVRGRVIDYRCPIGFANGCRVEPGDLIVGDIDGVLVVPRAQEQAIIASALNKVEGEERVRESIHAGKTTAEIFASTGIM